MVKKKKKAKKIKAWAIVNRYGILQERYEDGCGPDRSFAVYDDKLNAAYHKNNDKEKVIPVTIEYEI